MSYVQSFLNAHANRCMSIQNVYTLIYNYATKKSIDIRVYRQLSKWNMTIFTKA